MPVVADGGLSALPIVVDEDRDTVDVHVVPGGEVCPDRPAPAPVRDVDVVRTDGAV